METTIIRDWENEMYDVLRRTEQTQDMLSLYKDMNSIAKEQWKNGLNEVKNISFKNSNDDELLFVFHEDNAELVLTDKDTQEDILLVSLPDADTEEFRVLMDYDIEMKKNHIKIGEKYPEVMKEMLHNIEPGQMLIAENGTSYVCTENEGSNLVLIKTSDMTKYEEGLFDVNHEMYINLESDKDMQDIYDSAKDKQTKTVMMRIVDVSDVDKYITKQEEELKRGETNNINGNVSVKKGRFNNDIKWNGPKGDIQKKHLQYALTWMENAPVQTKFLHKNPKVQHNFLDDVAKRQLEVYYEGKNYEDAYQFLQDLVVSQEGELAVKINSYRSLDEGKSNSEEYAFTEKGAYVAKYDSEKNSYVVGKTTKDEFVDFCTEKYDDIQVIMQEQELEIFQMHYQEIVAFLDEINGIAEARFKEQQKDIDMNMLEESLNAYLKGYKDLDDIVDNSEDFVGIVSSFEEIYNKVMSGENEHESERVDELEEEYGNDKDEFQIEIDDDDER